MTKRTNRTAWGLAAVLAVALLGGIGAMLTHGIWLGSRYYGMYWDGKWAIGPDRSPVVCDLCMCGAGYHLGHLTLVEAYPDPMCDQLRSKASNRSGTAQ